MHPSLLRRCTVAIICPNNDINASATSPRQAAAMQPINLEAILPHLWISGRSSRAEWWRVHIICAVLATMLEHMMFAQLAPRDGGSMQPISLLWPMASLALAWVSFASVVRRIHDRGKSGWWALLYFVPGIGWLWTIIECGFLPGKPARARGNRLRCPRLPRVPHQGAAAGDAACRRPCSVRSASQ